MLASTFRRRCLDALRLLAPAAVLMQAVFAQTGFSQTSEQIEFFEKKIRPVLADKCQACHNANLATSGLDLSTLEGFVRGGQSGPLISTEDPAQSRLIQVIGYEERMKMPPLGKLSDQQIADLTQWVKMGAPWPGAAQVATIKPKKEIKEFTAEDRGFWAFQAVKDPTPPAVRNESFVRTPLDRFVLAKLEEKGIQPAPAADKLTLLRRATFDLTGLPPTEQEMQEFLADESPQAFRKVVERLLASPRYGERWGRHWLDVARYADSAGNDEDHRYPYAWRYRDYVIDAFNNDLPYDQFVREQIAGDLLPSDDPDGINRRGIIATGFLALGPKAVAQQDKKRMLYDVYDEQIDVMSRAFLGLTVACARCHDHKFDPILTSDYYSLAGIFASNRNFEAPEAHVSKLLFVPLVPEEQHLRYLHEQEEIQNKKFEIDEVVDEELKRYGDGLAPLLATYLLAAREVADTGQPAVEIAKAKGLDAAILERWVKYLELQQEEQRPHLQAWRQADDGKAAATAYAYQAAFEERLCEWQGALAKWRETYRAMTKEKNMPPPPRPKFSPDKDAFFHEVYFAGGGPFALPEEEQDKVFSTGALDQIAALRAELKRLEGNAMPEPPMACAIQEGEPVEQKVFIRGDYNSPGPEAPKQFPLILAGEHQQPVRQGSGRRALAEWLASGSNPLTARVMVNRIWHWHFGEGIVRTTSNFGTTGELPTHPELLDFLAKRFVESGWSVKQMHRLIMLSSAYRMSSETTAEQAEKDPVNELFSRFNRRRLDVEEIRDAMLAIDGSLDLGMGGTMQEGFGTDGENSNERLSINPETVNRRLVYLPLRRANLPTLLNLFDFGDAVTPIGNRPETTVAPQALFMMNSDFVAARSRNLAQALLAGEETANSIRLERAYLRTLNRKPSAEEADLGLTYLANLHKKFNGSASPLDAWQSLCRILIASNEFIYVD